jgi:hypothetical protein
MVGGHKKQIDSNTTSTSSSASASPVFADWDIAPPLQNRRVDTQYIGIIEEQKQQIKQLQEELAESIVSDIEHCQQVQAGGRMF